MADTCKMRIQIGDGDITDIATLGFFLAKSPSELACNVKGSNIITADFPEEDGEAFYIPTAPKLNSFDYTISLIFFDGSLNSANQKITGFYNSLLGQKVTVYNDFKQVKVVGYVKSYKSGEFYRKEKDVVIFDLTFYVPDPTLCDFCLVN